MRKIIAITVLLCVMVMPIAFAEGSIEGEAFQEAQYIPSILEKVTSYSYTLYEYDDEGNLDYADTFWFGKAEDGSIIVYELDSDGKGTYTTHGMSVICTMNGDSETLVYTHTAYESKMDDLMRLTMIDLGEEIVSYQNDSGNMIYAYSNNEHSESCHFDADTLRLINYTCNQIVGDAEIPVEQIAAQINTALSLPDYMRNVLEGKTRNIVIHTQDGEQLAFTVPADTAMYLMDEDYVTLSLNADMTTPVDCLTPGSDAEAWIYSPKE